jgi:uncharacterized protein (TIGR03437 family)
MINYSIRDQGECPVKNRSSSGVLFAISMAGALVLAAPKPDPAFDGLQLPLVFEANQGQAAPGVRFLARGKGYTLLLRDEGAVLRLPSSELRMRLAGSRRAKRVEALDPQPGTSSYFVGNNPAEWRRGIAQSGRVRYAEVYPGIDLVFKREASNRLEYDFVVAPGAHPSRIGVRFEGAQSIQPDGNGGIILQTASGEIRQPRPRIYQDSHSGRRQDVGGRMLLGKGNVIHFDLDAYDHSHALVIDPVIIGYIFSSVDEEFSGIARDSAGNVYVAGYTISPNFPATHTLGTPGQKFYHVFINKLSPDLATTYYSTVIGGNSKDYPTAIQVDSAGNAYIVGTTTSTNFPTVNAAQGSFGNKVTSVNLSAAPTDAFLLKLGPTGASLVYSTFLGGSSSDQALAVTVDGAGAAYATGTTTSQHFPVTPGALNRGPEVTMLGNLPEVWAAVWVAKLSSAGGPFDYVAAFGGADSSAGTAIAVDSAGNAYVAGDVGTGTIEDFPIVGNVVQPKRGGGLCNTCSNGFVSKLNPTGTNFVFSTYFGGSVTDVINGMTLDAGGNIYIVGTSDSPDLPVTAGVVGPGLLSGADTAFVAALNNSASAVLACSYLGGSTGTSQGNAVVVRAPGVIGMAGGVQNGPFLGLNNTINFLGGIYVELDPLFQSVIRTFTPYPYATVYTAVAVAPDGSVALGGTTQLLPGPNGSYSLTGRNGAVFLVAPPQTVVFTGSASPSVLAPGSSFTYTFTAKNTGSAAATHLALNAGFFGSAVQITGASISSGSCASLPSPPTSATCTTTSLAPGATITVTVTGMAVEAGSAQASASLGSADDNTEYSVVNIKVTGTGSGPEISTGGVVNGASFVGGGMVPGEVATIFGSNLTSSTGVNITSFPLPTTFLKDSVIINGSPVPLFAVDNVNGQQQFNFQVPWEVAGRPTATVAVSSNGATSTTITVPVLSAQPGIFNYTAGGDTFGAILHANFQLANTANPAKGGETVLIYCTGLGAVSSPPADGAAGNGQETTATPTVTIGGTKAIVSFSGLAPTFVGLYQINAEVPAGLKAGNQAVVITLSGASSNSVLLPIE